MHDNHNQNYIQDARNDEEGINQQLIKSFVTSSTSACTGLQMSQMSPSSNLPIVSFQHGSLTDYLEQLPGKQFQPVCNVMNETEQPIPEPELRPRPDLHLEPMSSIIQNDNKELTNSELNQILNRPLFTPDPSVSSHPDWNVEGDLDMSW